MYVRTITEFIKPNEHMMFNRDELYVPSQLHSHEFVEIEYILSGHGIQCINGRQYTIQRGDAIVLELNSQHSYYSTDRLVVFNCIIEPAIYEGVKRRILQADPNNNGTFLPDFIRLTGRHFMEVENMLLTTEREFEQKSLGYQLLCENNLSSLLLFLYRNVREATEEKDNDIKNNIQEYVNRNYTHLTLTEIATHFGYNPSYFSKFFKRLMGKNLFEYVADKKMQEATRLITTTNYSIESICHQLGYTDKKQFYKLFKEQTGETPNQFRKAHPFA